MAMDQPDRPSEPRSGAGDGPSIEQLASRDQLREFTGALAAGLPPASLPREPVSPETVRELAADIAAELLRLAATHRADTLTLTRGG